jgi:hypothetical protein
MRSASAAFACVKGVERGMLKDRCIGAPRRSQIYM